PRKLRFDVEMVRIFADVHAIRGQGLRRPEQIAPAKESVHQSPDLARQNVQWVMSRTLDSNRQSHNKPPNDRSRLLAAPLRRRNLYFKPRARTRFRAYWRNPLFFQHFCAIL